MAFLVSSVRINVPLPYASIVARRNEEASELFQGRAVSIPSQKEGRLFYAFFCPVWILCSAIDFNCLVVDKNEYDRLRMEQSRIEAIRNQLREVRQKIVVDGINFAGSLSYALSMGDSAGWIDLGRALGCVKGVGFVSSSFIYGTKIIEDWRAFKTQERDFAAALSEAERLNIKKKQLQIIINLAARICFLVWNLLEVTALIIGAPFLPLLGGALLTSNFVLTIAAWLQKREIIEPAAIDSRIT